MDWKLIALVIVPISIGMLLLLMVLMRFWFDKRLSIGGSLLAILAFVLIFGPRVVDAQVNGSGAKISMETFNKITDTNIEAVTDTVTAINAIRSRLDAIELTLKTLPNPKISTAQDGGIQWDFGTGKGGIIKPDEWCKAVPSLCGVNGQPKPLIPGQEIQWNDILAPAGQNTKLDTALGKLQGSVDALQTLKNANAGSLN